MAKRKTPARGIVESTASSPSAIAPTKAELEAARARTIPDVLKPGLRVVFCGINPGLYSGAVGHHFARPGNRFWLALRGAEFTDRLLSPLEDCRLLDYGLGCTNLVSRTTARADELTPIELRAGARRLREVLAQHTPAWLAVLGIGAYRQAFLNSRALVGPQSVTIGTTRVWLLPNPSGLNGHYQLDRLIEHFTILRHAAFGNDRTG
ncbi:MAG: G/U mismatch-specific DNA glycosylase [Candidatus Dormibacteraceae bacterium]